MKKYSDQKGKKEWPKKRLKKGQSPYPEAGLSASFSSEQDMGIYMEFCNRSAQKYG